MTRRSVFGAILAGLFGGRRAARAAVQPRRGLVVNCRENPWLGRLYDIFDARTGEKLKGLRIWYADEGRGIIRRYPTPIRIERGEVVSEELRRDIHIRLKPRWRSEAEGLAYLEEQWQRFRDGLDADLP